MINVLHFLTILCIESPFSAASHPPFHSDIHTPMGELMCSWPDPPAALTGVSESCPNCNAKMLIYLPHHMRCWESIPQSHSW